MKNIKQELVQERMGLGGNGGREELARENLELKASIFSLGSLLYLDLHPYKGQLEGPRQ